MSQTHIWIACTPEVKKVLPYPRTKFTLLSEAEIIKLALSWKYQKAIDEHADNEKKLREAFQHAMTEGGKLGRNLMKLMEERGSDQD